MSHYKKLDTKPKEKQFRQISPYLLAIEFSKDMFSKRVDCVKKYGEIWKQNFATFKKIEEADYQQTDESHTFQMNEIYLNENQTFRYTVEEGITYVYIFQNFSVKDQGLKDKLTKA